MGHNCEQVEANIGNREKRNYTTIGGKNNKFDLVVRGRCRPFEKKGILMASVWSIDRIN